MPRFPTREPDVFMLANAMIEGYTTNPTIFTSADIPAMQTAFDEYHTAKADQVDKQGLAELATETKDHKLEALVDFMKTQLKQSEVDVAADPERLDLIGWGPKAPPQPSDPPGQPRNLDPVVQGPGNRPPAVPAEPRGVTSSNVAKNPLAAARSTNGIRPVSPSKANSI